MRIFGGHDYYDSVLKTIGISSDDPHVFVRNNLTISNRDVRTANYGREKVEWIPFSTFIITHFRDMYNFNRKLVSRSSLQNPEVQPFEVYFCGTTYTGYAVDVVGHERFITYSYKSLVKYLSRFVKNDFPVRPSVFARNDYWNYKGEEYQDVISMRFTDKTYEYFLRKKIAFATNEPNSGLDYSVVINGHNLGKLKFQQVMDPFTAYQKIEAFVTNDLASSNDGPDITDNKIKIQKHGFDLKTSFRNPIK